MKKRCLLLSMITVFALSFTAHAEVEEEILFRDIPWGTSYTDIKDNIMPELWWDDLHGDWMRVLTINDIVSDSNDNNKFTNNDLCLNAYTIDEIDVAGYTAKQTDLYFAFVPSDGTITHEDSDTALYAAKYEIEPMDLESTFNDLLEKMKSIYGEPDVSTSYSIFIGCENLLFKWNGANDTMVVLKKEPYLEGGGAVHIIYVWKNGDEMLHEADDIISGIKTGEEASIYGNDNTDGL